MTRERGQNGRVRVELLGPVRVLVDGREVDLGGPRNRALTARLALAAGRAVRAATLVDDLWADDPPQDATNALQSVVSRTRRRLPAGAIELTPAGYVLRADTDVQDLQHALDERRYADAVRLVRGEPCQDLDELDFAVEAAERLSHQVKEARTEDLAQQVDAGQPDASALASLAGLADDHPLDDRIWTLYVQALADGGRAAEALDAYERHRRHLADELGTDPPEDLQRLHAALLRGESPGRADRSRLPVALTTFVGRDSTVRDLVDAVAEHRLVTIVGPGGAGKTRLAVEVGRRSQSPEVWLVELAAVTSAESVAPALLDGLELVEVSVLDRPARRASTAEDRLLGSASHLEGLLVLDNCEHLIDDVARITERLLAVAPGLRVLATSREPLRLTGEVVHPLDSLEVPPDGTPPEQAASCSAVDLFVQRATAVDRAFVLDDSNIEAVIEICARLDGQPLAIELATARLRTLTVQQIAARLGDRFRLLTGGSRTALPRHRTLRAVVEWSWDLLAGDERDLAERLSVLSGGVTAEAAEAIGGPGAADLLDALVDKSLLSPVRDHADVTGERRFRMLETLREFGTERLLERGILADVRRDQVSYCVDFAERWSPAMRDHRQIEAFGRIDAERGNISAGLRLAVDGQDRDSTLRLVHAMAWYWSIRNEHTEAWTWAATALGLPGEATPVAEVAGHALAITGSMLNGDMTVVDRHVDAILRIWDEHRPRDPLVDIVLACIDFFGRLGDRELPEPVDRWSRAGSTLMRLVLLDNAGRIGETIDLVDGAIEDFRALGDRWGLATTISHRGLIASYEGRFDDAIAAWQESLPLLEQLGAEEDIEFTRFKILGAQLATASVDELPAIRADLEAGFAQAKAVGSMRLVVTLGMALGSLERFAGNDARAVELYLSILDVAEESEEAGGGQLTASIRGALASSQIELGHLDLAREQLRLAFSLGLVTHDQPVLARIGVAVAQWAERAGDDAGAARLLGAIERVRGTIDRLNRDAVDLTDRLRSRMGDAFEPAYAAGLALEPAAAITLLTDGFLVP